VAIALAGLGCTDGTDKGDADTASDTDTDTDTEPETGGIPHSYTDDEPTCGVVGEPVVDRMDMTTWPTGAFLACEEFQADESFEDCSSLENVWPEDVLEAAWGGRPWNDRGCYWYAETVCGPEAAIPDACCYVFKDIDYFCNVEGRPFRVDGQARTAPPGTAPDWRADTDIQLTGLSRAKRRKIAQHWADAGRAEHASVAAFSRFATQLLALGAPAGLVAEATRAMADEINHARLCFGIASAAAGTELGVGGIDVTGSLDEVTHESVLVDTIREGCVNETICAAQAEAALEATTDPAIRAALEQIVEDEQRHATLAWKTVLWILKTQPELGSLAAETFAQATARPAPVCSQAQDDALASHGIPAEAEDRSVAARVLADVIAPCAAALLNTDDPVRVQASPTAKA